MFWSVLLFFSGTSWLWKIMLGKMSLVGTAVVGATVLPELQDRLSHSSSFLQNSLELLCEQIRDVMAALHLWQHLLPRKMSQPPLLKAMEGGNPRNFLISFWYSYLNGQVPLDCCGSCGNFFPTLTSVWVLLEKGLNNSNREMEREKGRKKGGEMKQKGVGDGRKKR